VAHCRARPKHGHWRIVCAWRKRDCRWRERSRRGWRRAAHEQGSNKPKFSRFAISHVRLQNIYFHPFVSDSTCSPAVRSRNGAHLPACSSLPARQPLPLVPACLTFYLDLNHFYRLICWPHTLDERPHTLESTHLVTRTHPRSQVLCSNGVDWFLLRKERVWTTRPHVLGHRVVFSSRARSWKLHGQRSRRCKLLH
jgi:hypothetical protein